MLSVGVPTLLCWGGLCGLGGECEALVLVDIPIDSHRLRQQGRPQGPLPLYPELVPTGRHTFFYKNYFLYFKNTKIISWKKNTNIIIFVFPSAAAETKIRR